MVKNKSSLKVSRVTIWSFVLLLDSTCLPYRTSRCALHCNHNIRSIHLNKSIQKLPDSCIDCALIAIRISSLEKHHLSLHHIHYSHIHIIMDMSSSSSDSMSMSSMSMVFTTDHSTPLFSKAWTPTSTGAYAGTCIFLIILAIIGRGLQAWRHVLEQRWHNQAINRRYVVVANKDEQAEDETANAPESKEQAVLTVRGVDEHVRVVRKGIQETSAWRISTDVPRACIFVVQAGVGYLL